MKELQSLKLIKEQLISTGKYFLDKGTEPDMSLDLLPVLNRRMWGISKRKMTIIAGRTSNAKTSLTLQFAYDISKTKRVLYLSLEDSYEELIGKLFCMEMSIDNQKFQSLGIRKYMDKWDEFSKRLENRKLVISHEMGKSWSDIQMILDNVQPLPDLIILDYIQCITNKGISKMEAIEDYIKSFRSSAVERNFGIILLSQINRSNVEGGKEPTMSGLKGCGAMEEHSDKVLICHWEYQADQTKDMNEFKLIIAKNKTGMTGIMKLKFEPKYSRFSEDIFSQPSPIINQRMKNKEDFRRGPR